MDTALSQPLDLSLVELVGHHAASIPHAVALVAGTEVVTYLELENRANQLAHQLNALGAGRDHLVGLYMERCPAMVVAALAILKAGAAYLPLDPASPPERVSFVLRDAGISALVSRESMPQRPPSGTWPVVALDRDREQIAKQPVESPETRIKPGDLAYVIYTSGSTGQPKGVEITHRGIANLIAWHCRAFQVTSADHASMLAALGFDAAVWELWPYLAAGATVHIPESSVCNNPETLRDWLIAHQITISFLPTALAECMLLLDWPPNTPLRLLLTGADTLHRRPPGDLPFSLVNNYGPTECTVVATSGMVAPEVPISCKPSIGRPIDNTRVYILDEQMQPVAPGEPGEIYIGGAGLARGYRNRPELTTEKFVRNPFSSDATDRLYRTGDLACFLPSGEIDFVGRLDEQLKIRGYRVEPNEIVAALESHPAIQASVVVDREDSTAEKRLTAYVVLKPSREVTACSLREYMRNRLPDYMIPSVFIQLERLPLTENGKVDRAMLPAPSGSNSLPDDSYVAPRGIVEQRLASMIAPLLHVDRVGVNDNFFLLGGHSLLGTQLVTRINETFGVELTLLSLFDHPTLAEISSEIERAILAKVGGMSTEEVGNEFSQVRMEGTL